MSGGAFDYPHHSAEVLASTLIEMADAANDTEELDAEIAGRLEALGEELDAAKPLLRAMDKAFAGDISLADVDVEMPRTMYDNWSYGDACPNCGSTHGYTERLVCYGNQSIDDGTPTTFKQTHIGQELDVFCEACGEHLLERPKEQAGR